MLQTYRGIFSLICLVVLSQTAPASTMDPLLEEDDCFDSMDARGTKRSRLTAFEDSYPEHATSLRVLLPKLYRQILEERESFSNIYSFAIAPDVGGVAATTLMDRMREGSNEVAKRLQKLRARVDKEISGVDRDINREQKKRHLTGISALRDRKNTLIMASRVLDIGSRLFHLGPIDLEAPYGQATQRKWTKYRELYSRMTGVTFPHRAKLHDWFSDLEHDFNWAWLNIRLAFCLPSLDRVLTRFSDLGFQHDELGSRFMAAKFKAEGGETALAELRPYRHPVLFGSVTWEDTLEIAERYRTSGASKFLPIHFFFMGGIDGPARVALQERGFVVHGPAVDTAP